MKLVDILIKYKLIKSKSELRRLISQNAVKFSEVLPPKWEAVEVGWEPFISCVIKIGKRRFLKILTPWRIESIPEEVDEMIWRGIKFIKEKKCLPIRRKYE